jgi:hypothetical protein
MCAAANKLKLSNPVSSRVLGHQLNQGASMLATHKQTIIKYDDVRKMHGI